MEERNSREQDGAEPGEPRPPDRRPSLGSVCLLSWRSPSPAFHPSVLPPFRPRRHRSMMEATVSEEETPGSGGSHPPSLGLDTDPATCYPGGVTVLAPSASSRE